MLKIAITGPESTGKSTVAEKLARHYDTVWVPEYARTYIGNLGRTYTLEDIEAIARGQVALEQELKSKADKLYFADTDMLVLKIWSEHAFGHVPAYILEKLKQQDYNLYLLMGVDLPWEPDPQREHPHMRQFFYDWYKRELEAMGAPFVEVSGQQDARFELVRLHVENLLPTVNNL
ncbi:AAA family ATPase [Pontibacter ruber]|uniref:AAA family ATPase n=1 Tax=Pontibacter ruber TaxID=1343895 RepID=A0ABW5CXZ7_9BACT|nr:ATP-binding protein [Pontibacter ruber]